MNLFSVQELNDEGEVINYEAISDWMRRDVLARNYLVATIEPQQQRTLINCRTAFEMWTRLSAQHLQNAAENQHVLQHRFYEYQYQPNHDVMSHITEIETLASQLSDVGAPMTDIQIMTKIICTLPPSYRNFATIWDSVPVNERTMSLLTSRLLKEESNTLRWSRGQQDAADTSFFAQNYPNTYAPSPRESRGGRASRGRGDRGRGGHHRNGSARYRPYVKCTYCDKDWHTHEECRKRKRDDLAKSNATGAAVTDFLPMNRMSLKQMSDRPNQDTSEANQDHSFISNSTCFIARRSQDWFADSGATQHMSDQREFFKEFTAVKPNTWFVKGIGGAQLQVHGQGSIEFTALVDGTKRTIKIETVLFVPDLGVNLLSIAAVTEVGVSVHFIESNVSFNQNDTVVMVGERIGRTLYHLAITVDPPCDWACFTTPAPPSIDVWHQRLAHTSTKKIRKMASLQMVNGLILPIEDVSRIHPCTGCMSGKMERSKFKSGRTRAIQVGQLIHSDVCGPMHVATPRGSRYFVLFSDDFSGYRSVYFLKQKSEVADSFREYVNHLRTETGQMVHTLRADNGGEFIGHHFKEWLSNHGIKLETSAPHTPEQNGVSERANRTIMEAARSLIHAKNVPLELWGEAIACAVYTLNRVSTKTTPNTPYQNWFGTKPDVSNLRIFGSTAYIHVPKAERRKLDSKSVTCHFVGYCATQKAYRFWDPITRKIRISRDVIFNEQAFDTSRQDPTSDIDFSARRLLLGPLASTPKEALPENVVDTMPSPPHNENTLSDPILLPESPTIDPFPPTPIVDYPPSISPAPEANPPSPNIHLQDDVNTNAPNNHVRHSKYPLRIREPKS